jgi:transposase
MRWLPDEARRVARSQRAAEIIRLHDEGLSNREVARRIGVDEGTVRNVSAEKSHSAEIPHPATEPPAWVQKLRELDSPHAQAWSSALRRRTHPMRGRVSERRVGVVEGTVPNISAQKSHRGG